MLRVAIVEDNEQEAQLLTAYLKRYGKEKDVDIEPTHFKNALLFLQQYRGEYGIVFMDIDMPMLNGIDAARRLREVDPKVVLIFVTALARFAVNGYEVNAFDFVVKPVQYNLFVTKLTRALKEISTEKRTSLLIKSGEKTVRVYADEVLYVDIHNHVLSFHTQRETVETRGTMKDVVEALNENSFAMCNKSCVVNLMHMQMVDGDDVVLVSGERLQISRPRKTAFMQQIADYYGNKKINMGRF